MSVFAVPQCMKVEELSQCFLDFLLFCFMSGGSRSRRIAQLWAPPPWAPRMRTASMTPTTSPPSWARATCRPPTAEGRRGRERRGLKKDLQVREKVLRASRTLKNSVAMHYRFALQLLLVFIFSAAVQQRRGIGINQIAFFGAFSRDCFSIVVFFSGLRPSVSLCWREIDTRFLVYSSSNLVFREDLCRLFFVSTIVTVHYCGSTLLWHDFRSEVIQ